MGNFLDKTGLTYVWRKAHSTFSKSSHTHTMSEVSDLIGQGFPFIVGTQTATTASWEGKAPTISSLYDGLTILYYLPYTSASNATLNLTLKSGSTTGAINLYYSGTTRLSTHYAAGNVIRLTYMTSKSINGSGSYTGWWAEANYDTNNYDRIRYQQAIKAGSTAIVAANIIVPAIQSDGTFLYTHLKLGNAFDMRAPILYPTAAIAAGATATTNYLMYPLTITTTQAASTATTSWGEAITAYKPVYIKGTLSGTTFTPINTTPLRLKLTDDGYHYMLLGMTYSATAMYLLAEHPVFNGDGTPVVNIALKTINGTAITGSGDISVATAAQGAKADTALQSHQTLKTINNTSLVGGGNISVLTAHQDISGKADKATTLAGYGISDAKISSGTITLGSNTITPLTAHQSLSGYAKTTDVTSGDTTTLNSAKSYADGLAKNYATAAQGAKADTALQSHQTLKTINGQSLVGSGNITISGGTSIDGITNIGNSIVIEHGRLLEFESTNGSATGTALLNHLFSPVFINLNGLGFTDGDFQDINYDLLMGVLDDHVENGVNMIVRCEGKYFVVYNRRIRLSALPIFENYEAAAMYDSETSLLCYVYSDETDRFELCIRVDGRTAEAVGGDFSNTSDGVPLGRHSVANVNLILEKLMRI